MAGTSANTSLWTGADVYLAAANATGPTDTTTAWAVAWTAVGLLDGETGFVEGRSDDSNDFYAWGGTLVKTYKTHHKRTVKFTMLETNAAVFGLLNPGSTTTTASGLTTNVLKTPTWGRIGIGFEVTDGTVVKRRFAKQAMITDISDVVDKETALTAYEVTVTLYPDAAGTIYTELIK